MMARWSSVTSDMRRLTRTLTYLLTHNLYPLTFTARRYASAAYAIALCLSVRLFVCHKSEFYQNR